MTNTNPPDTITVSFITHMHGETVAADLPASTPLYLRPDVATDDDGLMVPLDELIRCGTLGSPADNAGWSVEDRPCLYVPGAALVADVGEAIENFLAEDDTVTDEQIEALMAEALAAGDDAMVATCGHALAPATGVGIRGRIRRRAAARAECARVIRDAQA